MEENSLQETYPLSLKLIARLISFLFHPLFVGVMMAAYLLFWHPNYFVGIDNRVKLFKLVTFTINNVVFPGLVVLLLKGLGFSKSIHLSTQKERIVPYVASITFFFWCYYVFKNQPGNPESFIHMCRSMFFAACAALMLNNYFKISMHGIACGGFVGLILLTILDGTVSSALPMTIALLISGLVFSARKIVTNHSWFDLITGFLLGFLCQMTALLF